MWMICKALVLLLLELIIEYLFGTMLTKLILKREVNPVMSMLTGFMAYQAIFQAASLGFTLTTDVLHHLSITWCVVVVLTVLMSICSGRKTVKKQIRSCFRFVKEHRDYVLAAGLVVAAFCYYVSINGEQNDDAAYYIALMTTTVETDSLFKYNVYTGLEMDSLYLRRAIATFEIQSAVISQVFDIHPIIVARIFRACQNVILTSGAVLLSSHTLFWKREKDAVNKSLLTVVVFWLLQTSFANTIYTPATFLLYRAYEAKAFTANVIVILGLYLCLKYHREQDKRMLIVIGIYLWGSMALSVSAIMLAAAECLILLVPVWMQRMVEKRKQEKLHAG